MKITSRHEWGTADPDGSTLGPPMTLPAIGAFLHHSVTVATDDPHADMRAIEAVGFSRFGRFSYCYAIHPSGEVMEGAGRTVGAHTDEHNSRYFGIVFIGNLMIAPLTAAAETAAVELLRHLADTDGLRPGWSLKGHRDQKATACPGDHVYARLHAIQEAANHPEGDDMYTDADRARDTDTNDKVTELLTIARKLQADYLTPGKGVRQEVAVLVKRTGDLVSGARPAKKATPAKKAPASTSTK